MATKTKPTPAAKPTKAKKVKPAWEGREVVYPTPHTTLYDDSKDGDGLFTVDMAKELLGWLEEGEDGDKFGDDYFLKHDGHKVRLTNNITNRPWYSSNTEALKQEMLFGRWKLNMEPIIITQRGLVANGQHQMIALILAEAERQANPKAWKKVWGDDPVCIPKLVGYGVEDTDDVLDTMDTGKPRSLGDILFRGPHFASIKASERASIAKVCEGAVKLLWERTGAYVGTDAYSPRRTHGEMMEFLGRHPKLLDAVKHVWEEDDAVQVEGADGPKKVRRISRVVSAGRAAAMLYLMAASQTDRAESGYATKMRESALDLGLWDKACEYWTLVAGSDDCKGVPDAVASLYDQAGDEGGPSVADRLEICVRGWHAFVTDGSVTEYEGLLDPEGPTDCGGVDLGPKSTAEPVTPEGDEDGEQDGEMITDGEGDVTTAEAEQEQSDIVDGEQAEDGEAVPTPDEVEQAKAKEGPQKKKNPKPTKK